MPYDMRRNSFRAIPSSDNKVEIEILSKEPDDKQVSKPEMDRKDTLDMLQYQKIPLNYC